MSIIIDDLGRVRALRAYLVIPSITFLTRCMTIVAYVVYQGLFGLAGGTCVLCAGACRAVEITANTRAGL